MLLKKEGWREERGLFKKLEIVGEQNGMLTCAIPNCWCNWLMFEGFCINFFKGTKL